ncbi:MAG: phosphoglycerate dehydrogenase [Gemmatimonadota bacterium]
MGVKRVLVADALTPEGVSILQEATGLAVEDRVGVSRAELRQALRGASGLVVRSGTRVDAELLGAADALEVIGRAGVGLDNIDLEAATRRGVAVLNAPAGNTISTTELAFGLLLAAARKIAAADRSVRGGEWDRRGLTGAQLCGRTLGVVGVGRIGTEMTRRARAFGLAVLAYDPYVDPDRAEELGIRIVELDELLSRADFVTLHLPLTDETRGLLDAERIARMRPGAILVNTARGGLVDEQALAAALRSGRLAAAALDVFETEPLPSDHPLRNAPNLTLTPHIGASTPEAQAKVATEIALAVRDALLEGDLRAAVNVTPIGVAERRRLQPILELARRLGRAAAGLSGGTATRLEVRLAAPEQRGLRLVASAVVAGFLRDLETGPLNFVNALAVAAERGLEVERSRLKPQAGHVAWVEVVAVGGARPASLAGALRGDLSGGIVRVDGYPVNVAPRGTLLFVRNRDVPGVVGQVGTRLGDAGVNIGEFHQARDTKGGEALAVIGLDEELSPSSLRELRALPEVLDATQVRLDD